MSGFLYYLPGEAPVTRARVEAAGLGYLFDGARGPGPEVRETTTGPDGGKGFVFTVAGRDGRGELARELLDEDERRVAAVPGEASRVVWASMPGGPAWLAYHSEARPTPEDLGRHKRVDGHEVELADGQLWLVPVVRARGGATRLPRRLVWDGKDWRHGDVQPIYRDLWAAGLRLWDMIEGAAEGELVTLTEETSTVVAALALNYRIGPGEVSALGLLDTEASSAVLSALIDLRAFGVIRGKAEAATRS